MLQVLLRALRDFNLGKLTADDTGIFLGLLNDLFPKTAEQVPRAIDHAFEPKVHPVPHADPLFLLLLLDWRCSESAGMHRSTTTARAQYAACPGLAVAAPAGSTDSTEGCAMPTHLTHPADHVLTLQSQALSAWLATRQRECWQPAQST